MRAFPSSVAWRRAVAPILVILAAAFAWNLLWCCWCLYVGRQFRLFDYGLYTNFLWNSGRGDFFRCLVNDSYLVNHLSFSLLPLGLLYRLWDDAFVLMVAQWSFPLWGALFLAAAGRRHGLPAPWLAALALFYVGYRFTQQILTAEFHGVSFYLILVPWLYYALSFHKAWTPVPLAFVLGVREDAFLAVLPMLLYFAWKDRWRAGYLWAVAAAAYGAFAIGVLYPWLNDLSLFARRSRDGSLLSVSDLLADGAPLRWAKAVVWTLLPAAVCLRRGSLPAFVFPSFALAQCLLSGIDRQQSLGIHYSAPVMSTLACGLVEALARRRAGSHAVGSERPAAGWRIAALVAIVAAGHLYSGYAWGGRAWSDPHVRRASAAGREAREAARQVPKDGVLLADDDVVCFAANRADVIDLRRYDPAHHAVDWMLIKEERLPGRFGGRLRAALEEGTWGVHATHGPWLVLAKGGDTSLNARVLADLGRRLFVAGTPTHHGATVYAGGRALRHWGGDGSRAPSDLSHGATLDAPAGESFVELVYRVRKPRRVVRGYWGELTLHEPGRPDTLARAVLPPRVTPPDGWSTQAVYLARAEAGPVEFRVVGGDAELWLEYVRIRPGGI